MLTNLKAKAAFTRLIGSDVAKFASQPIDLPDAFADGFAGTASLDEAIDQPNVSGESRRLTEQEKAKAEKPKPWYKEYVESPHPVLVHRDRRFLRLQNRHHGQGEAS